MQENHGKMTEGPISKKIISFALPVFWGSLFQQLYNVVDSLVVGNFIGRNALAAVSSAGSLTFLMVGFFSGIFMGAGVVISRYYGAGLKKRVSNAVHTTVAFGIVSGLCLTLIGTFLSPVILRLIKTPAEVLPDSLTYFRIFFCGSLTFILYNTAAGIFQAVGDSKHPLYYLLISSAVNVVLDIVFVAFFNMGIAGAAYATVLSQAISAVLAFCRLARVNGEYRVEIKKIGFDKEMIGQILTMGIPSGLQNSIIALANIVVQSNINVFGPMAVAGCGVYSKIEGFGFLPITSFTMAMTTFIGQNLGAKEYERARKGARFGILTCMVLAEAVGAAIYVSAPYLVAAFNRDPEVIRYGVMQARVITLFYCLLAFSHCVSAILRGAGRSVVPLIVMMSFWCVVRVTYITIIMHYTDDIRAVFAAYPLTWSLSSITFLIYYLKADWLHYFDRSAPKKI